ncbi:MAG TPA: isoprenylcysteine carboxylmethyltransferase family protein [Thermoanaerobaculia bacterium]|nr:isoprenylcysteine carboxylmethyltransferase family protein [Thermoanaerobaculia bacterium]
MAARLFALARAIVVAAIFVSLWTWFAPRWIAMSKHVALAPQLGVVSIILMLAGGAIMARCVWDFAWTGRGTPAPFDPPRHLVVRGLYRWVRNPMYVGMGLFLVGEALALPAITREMFILIAALWLAVSLLILAYEEPALRGTFGDDYRHYCAHVRRWLPRLTPFDKSTTQP